MSRNHCWKNVPADVLRHLLSYLDYRSVYNLSCSLRQVRMVCDEEFWHNRTLAEFGPASYREAYPVHYFNYLAGRVNFLLNQIKEAAHTIVPYFQALAHSKRIVQSIERQPLDYIKRQIKNPSPNTIFYLLNHLTSIQEQHPYVQGTVEQNRIILESFFDRTKHLQKNIKEWHDEADSISLFLAYQIRKIHLDQFNLVQLEHVTRCPDSLYDQIERHHEGIVDGSYTVSLIKMKMDALEIKVNDIIITGRSHLFTTNLLGLLKMEVKGRFSWYNYNDIPSLEKLEDDPIIEGTELFKKFCSKFGLTETGICWLYGLTDEVMAQIAEKIENLEKKVESNKLTKERTASLLDFLYDKLDQLNQRKERISRLINKRRLKKR